MQLPKFPKFNIALSQISPKQFLINSVLILFIIFSLTIITYHLAYQNKVYPGVLILDTNFGNQTKKEARALLESTSVGGETDHYTITAGNVSKNFSLSEIGLKPDLDASVEQAYSLGREDNPLVSSLNKIRSWKRGFNLGIILTQDKSKFDQFVDTFIAEVSSDPEDATLVLEKDTLKIKDSQAGLSLDKNVVRETILSKISRLVKEIILEPTVLDPKITSTGAADAYEKVSQLLTQNFSFNYEKQTFPISKESLFGLLTFATYSQDKEGVFYTLVENKDPGTLNTLILEERVKTLLSGTAKKINRTPVNAKFAFVGGRVQGFTAAVTGLSIDEKSTLENFKTALEKNSGAINLVVTKTEPEVSNESVNNLGINELIGRGYSKFVGSIPNRVYNISLASSKVNGTLVPPGETFSLYKTIGEVDQSTGYKEAYIINNNRTELDWGGGVCQVSTTLFRAALNAGLPIVERNPHAYRVGYYEQAGDPGNGKPGVDAAVFFPRTDFRFKNDTPSHILVQTVFDEKNKSLAFEIFGSNDGRRVSISTPTVSNQIKPPDTLYQDDPTLPKGVTKQVDFSAWGATTNFKRTVTRGNETLISDSFSTKYRPWQAIYLVGTKEDNPAPTEPTPAN